MKFFAAVSLFSLATGAVADATIKHASPVKRDLTTITGVINDINQAVGQLDTAVKGFNGAGQIGSLNSASSNVLSKISNGAKTVQGTSQISLSDALALQPIVQGLQTTTNTTISDLIAKKSALVAAGAGSVVEQQLNQQKSDATDLSNAISSKVPSSVSSLAQQLSSGITDSIQQGIDAFQGTGGGSSSSSAAGGSSSSAASSSASSSAASSAGSSSAPFATSSSTGQAPSGVAAPTGGASSTGSSGNNTATSSPVPFPGSAPAGASISGAFVGVFALIAAGMML